MKLELEKLIQESSENMTVSTLAQEMTDAGLFKNHKSAYDMLRYHLAGKSRSVDWEMLKYLTKRFNKEVSEIIQWDDK
jgi:succinate dehydrogenase/fumarate reductase flavoprotein subunit